MGPLMFGTWGQEPNQKVLGLIWELGLTNSWAIVWDLGVDSEPNPSFFFGGGWGLGSKPKLWALVLCLG